MEKQSSTGTRITVLILIVGAAFSALWMGLAANQFLDQFYAARDSSAYIYGVSLKELTTNSALVEVVVLVSNSRSSPITLQGMSGRLLLNGQLIDPLSLALGITFSNVVNKTINIALNIDPSYLKILDNANQTATWNWSLSAKITLGTILGEFTTDSSWHS